MPFKLYLDSRFRQDTGGNNTDSEFSIVRQAGGGLLQVSAIEPLVEDDAGWLLCEERLGRLPRCWCAHGNIAGPLCGLRERESVAVVDVVVAGEQCHVRASRIVPTVAAAPARSMLG